MSKSADLKMQQPTIGDMAGICVPTGQGEQDNDASVSWTKRAALSGYEKPTMELRLAAEQGNADAQFELACMLQYEEDEWCPGDESGPDDGRESTRWFRLAAEQGQPGGQHIVGSWYFCGYIVPQDYLAAVKWYTLAAEQGNALAQYELGEMYFRGVEVPQDFEQAAKWFHLAALQLVLPRNAILV